MPGLDASFRFHLVGRQQEEIGLMIGKIGGSLSKQSRTSIMAEAAALVAIIGFLDLVTGYEASIAVLYLAPISFVAWYAGKNCGLAVAILSAIVWLLADIGAGHTTNYYAIPVWNSLILLSSFVVVVIMLVKLKVAYEEQLRLVAELREASDKIKVLKGLIPICAWCRRVRDDDGYWQAVEDYIRENSEASSRTEYALSVETKCKRSFKPSSKMSRRWVGIYRT